MMEDLASKDALTRMTQQVVDMIKRNTPIRFGVLPMVTDANSASKLTMMIHPIVSDIY